MAEENQGLETSNTEPSSVFSGELIVEGNESPVGDGSQSLESPDTDGAGQSASQAGDSELDGIFTDLEKDIPETLKPRAGNVKKKLQGYFTKKNQAISKEVEDLRKNQITDEYRNEFKKLYTWAEKVQRDPINGLRELASQLGVDPKTLIQSAQTQVEEPELHPSQLVTREDYVKYAHQLAEKKTKPLLEKVESLNKTLTNLQGGAEKREKIERGAKVLKEAESLPGFVLTDKAGNKQFSEMGKEAIQLVLKGEFQGPTAVERAFFYLQGREAPKKVKELETQLTTLKQNVRGATLPPDGHSPKTVTPPFKGSVEDKWARLKEEPLS